MMLYPERRFFQTNEQSGTMVAIYSTLREDLYVVFAGENPETQAPVIHAYLNPLVKWIWLGGLVVVLGTLVTLLPNRRAVLVLAAAPERAGAQQPAAQALTPSVALREGMIKRRVVAVSLLIAISASSAALFSSRAQAQQTSRAKQIGGKFMCMCTCNQVLTQCNHVGCTTSASMLKELDGWVARGDSETVITSAFVQEFGTKVYAEPPRSGLSFGGLEPADRLFAAGHIAGDFRNLAVAFTCSCCGLLL